MASTPGGMSSLSALAVLRLTTNSNFVGCTTGRSAGFSSLRIWPVGAGAEWLPLLAEALFGVAHVLRLRWQRVAKACVLPP
jgi:hypothetical protein